MTPAEWLACATADIERRNLPELRPILESLARAVMTLRASDQHSPVSEREEPGEADSRER